MSNLGKIIFFIMSSFLVVTIGNFIFIEMDEVISSSDMNVTPEYFPVLEITYNFKFVFIAAIILGNFIIIFSLFNNNEDEVVGSDDLNEEIEEVYEVDEIPSRKQTYQEYVAERLQVENIMK